MADTIDLENEVTNTAFEPSVDEALSLDNTVEIVDLDSLGTSGGRGGKLSPQSEHAERKILPVIRAVMADGQARQVTLDTTFKGATAAKAYKAARKTVYRVFFRNDLRAEDATYRLFAQGDLQSPLTAARAVENEDGTYIISGLTAVIIPVNI